MSVGKTSGQAGNTIPLQGEAELRQTSSAADVLTITLASGVTSTAGGQGLVVRRNAPEGASGGTEMFAVEYDGTRGRRHVIAVSTASTGLTVASSQSGSLFVIGDCTAAPLTITLPAMDAGLWYEFYQGGAVTASGTMVAAATAGTMVVFNDAAANSVHMAGSTGTAIGGSLRVITDGTKWYTIMQPAFTSAAPATGTMTLFGIVT